MPAGGEARRSRRRSAVHAHSVPHNPLRPALSAEAGPSGTHAGQEVDQQQDAQWQLLQRSLPGSWDTLPHSALVSRAGARPRSGPPPGPAAPSPRMHALPSAPARPPAAPTCSHVPEHAAICPPIGTHLNTLAQYAPAQIT